jgi:hypothetical protein
MAARYLFPDKKITFDQLAEIADYHVGYVVWGFPVWQWLIEQGAEITDYDIVDYGAWAKDGIDGYRKSVSEEHFNYVTGQTFDIKKDTKNLQKLYGNPVFHFVKKVVDWEDVLENFRKPGICDLTLAMGVIDGKNELLLHRVVLLDITDTEVIYHDPNNAGNGANRHTPIDIFKKAFLAIPDGSEICHYCLRKE